MKRIPYADLHHVQEDERIRLIGEKARAQTVGVFLEKDEPEKVARYIRKVTERYPGVTHLDTTDGPSPLLVLVRFGPKQ